ncbi:MAG: cupredoxin domain-containing protein [Actinomycetota bacterium]
MARLHGAPALVAMALSLGLVATACAEERPAVTADGGGEDQGAEEQGTITIAGQEATNHGSEDVTGASGIEVEVNDFYFAPTVLEGEAGQDLSVSLLNDGAAPHTFTIDDQDVDVQLGAGESGQAEVTFPDSGALVFYCRFHVSGGMLGGLSVGGDLAAAAAGSGGGGGSGEGESEDQPSGPGY